MLYLYYKIVLTILRYTNLDYVKCEYTGIK